MKNIIPALGKLQLACMDRSAPLGDIGRARQELFAAIRQAIREGMACATPSPNDACQKLCDTYLEKFDKLNQ